MRPRYLISRLSSLGDVVCTLPVATCLKSAFPDAEIVWAVDPRFAGVVECCSSVDSILKVKPGLNPASWPRVEGEFAAAFDMQGLFKSGIIVAKAKSKTKLGYHWQREASWLFSRRVLPDPTSAHVVDQYVDVARAAGGGADAAEFQLKPEQMDIDSTAEILKSCDITGRYVVMNPGAGWVTKRWPPQHFAALIDLVHGIGIQTVLIAGKAPADHQAVGEVVELCKNPPVSLVGKTSVRELIALISKSGAHVGGDTGSTHIAAAVSVPAIGLYSITRPERSCPYGQISKCHYDPESLSNIKPEAVFETLKEALS